MPKKEIIFFRIKKWARAESIITCLEAAKTAEVDLTSINHLGKHIKFKDIFETGKKKH